MLKEIHSQMSLEEIDNLMLDTQEAMEYQRQIEEALSGQLTVEDEDAVLAELEELEKEVRASCIAVVIDAVITPLLLLVCCMFSQAVQAAVSKMPSVPDTEPEVQEPVKAPPQKNKAKQPQLVAA